MVALVLGPAQGLRSAPPSQRLCLDPSAAWQFRALAGTSRYEHCCTVITNSKVYREWDAEASRLYDGSLAGVARYAKAWSARIFEGLPAPGKALWTGRAALGMGPAPVLQRYQQLGPHFIADAAALAAPAVVNISVKGASAAGSCGSGFVLDADGTILTNAHVVADASVKTGRGAGPARPPPVHITLQDGRVFEGRVVACDRVSDLATVKIEAGPGLPVARLGSSAGLRVGEWVVALGSPLHLHNSVTAGIVSCTDRKAADLGLSGESAEFIQTDAAVNSGNSGGPLINLAGEVVGISSMKAVTAHGVSFAIPIDAAKAVLKQLAESGRVVRPYIGIKMLQLSAATAAQLRARDPAFPPVRAGILVPQVAAGSPAARAGLRVGDVIIGYGGEDNAVSVKGLVAALAAHIGAPLELRVRRHGMPGPVALSVLAEEAPLA